MSHQDGLSQWSATVSTRLPQLSGPQAAVLAVWSDGMVVAQSCGITTVAPFLGTLRGQPAGTLRQRLREWCYDASDKRGDQRRDLDVTTCFAPLLSWVLAWWVPGERRLALALDARTLGQRVTVLTISVVYRGCAIPVAWRVVRATEKGAWRPHWQALLLDLDPAVPAAWTVVVLADRGLYARWLYQCIQARGWHPFLRINQGGLFRPHDGGGVRALAAAAPRVGTGWCGTVDCFATRACRLTCTLLARWDASHAAPWLILTDLPPAAAAVAWYGMRAWIECGFKDTKRGGWPWRQTKMTDPARAARAARLWLVIAVATLWAVSVGGAAEATLSASGLDAWPDLHAARRRAASGVATPPAELLPPRRPHHPGRPHRRIRPPAGSVLSPLLAPVRACRPAPLRWGTGCVTKPTLERRIRAPSGTSILTRPK